MKNQKIFSYCSSIHKCRYGKAFHNGTVHCVFDNGRSLGVVPGEDSFRKLTAEELAEEQEMTESQELGMKMQ